MEASRKLSRIGNLQLEDSHGGNPSSNPVRGWLSERLFACVLTYRDSGVSLHAVCS
jgi:hypothetical protein